MSFKSHVTIITSVLTGIFLVCGAGFFFINSNKSVWTEAISLSEIDPEGLEPNFSLYANVQNKRNVKFEEISTLSYEKNTYQLVVDFLKPIVPIVEEKNITIWVTPADNNPDYTTLDPHEVNIAVTGCDFSDAENNRLKYKILPGSSLNFNVPIIVNDELKDINALAGTPLIDEITNQHFQYIKSENNPDLIWNNEEGDAGIITSDDEFRYKVLNLLRKNIDQNIGFDDYTIAIAYDQIDRASNSQPVTIQGPNGVLNYFDKYDIPVNIIANPESTLITGEVAFSIPVNIEWQKFDVKNITNAIIADQTIDALVNDVNNVTANEITAAHESSEFKKNILASLRKVSSNVMLTDFYITSTAAAGNFNVSGFYKNVVATVHAAQNNTTIQGQCTFNLRFKVHEQTITYDYSAQYPINYNLGNGETFNIQGHASVRVTLTNLEVKFKWSVPKNFVSNNHQYKLMDLYNDNYISDFSIKFGANSRVYTDVDGMAEMAGQKDETTPLASFGEVSPIDKKNNKYYFGYNRNGSMIVSTREFQSVTPASAPLATQPSIWFTAADSGTITWNTFWESIIVTIDANNILTSAIPTTKAIKFYVSSTDNNKNFYFSNVTTQTKFNVKTGGAA